MWGERRGGWESMKGPVSCVEKLTLHPEHDVESTKGLKEGGATKRSAV